jgi:hypothetical protein
MPLRSDRIAPWSGGTGRDVRATRARFSNMTGYHSMAGNAGGGSNSCHDAIFLTPGDLVALRRAGRRTPRWCSRCERGCRDDRQQAGLPPVPPGAGGRPITNLPASPEVGGLAATSVNVAG